MPELLGGGPLLLGLLLANQNNNNNAAGNPGASGGAIPSTLVVHEQVVEADYPEILGHTRPNLGHLLFNQDGNPSNLPDGTGAVLGTVVAREQVVKVDYPELLGGAPLLAGLLLANQNNNNAAAGGVIPSTLVVHEQAVEAGYLRAKAEQPLKAGVLYLRAESPAPKALTQAQCDFYTKNGYLVLPNAISADEATKLLQEAHNVMDRISRGGEDITRHDTSNGDELPTPHGRILATFESAPSLYSPPPPPAAPTPVSNSSLRPIARLGCGVHSRLPAFHTLTHSPLHRSITHSLSYIKPRITQSQIIVKPAHTGGRIIPHQDGCVSFTNPSSGLTFWYALEDATLENGCLQVAAGSHLTDPLRQRLVKDEKGRPFFEELEEPVWAREVDGGTRAQGADAKGVGQGQNVHEYEYTPLEVKKGTLVLFHGNLMHASARNTSGKSRIAYMFSVVEGGLEAPADGYMRPVEGRAGDL
ncbi:hypothetical protein MMC30_005857 [Trapelia coarctata]|nr:hypothetical protein [Trapelia coarctata]